MNARADTAQRRLRLLQSACNLVARIGRCILARKKCCGDGRNTTLGAVETCQGSARRGCHGGVAV